MSRECCGHADTGWLITLCQVFAVITRQINDCGLCWGVTNWLDRLIGETQVRLLGLLRRSRQTITSLAEALGLTDNAVRMHIAALHRDGIVAQVGVQRDTGGKPARLYGLTREGEELFPKAYAFVLGALVEEIVRTQGRARAIALLPRRRAGSCRRATGRRNQRQAENGGRRRRLSPPGHRCVSREDRGWVASAGVRLSPVCRNDWSRGDVRAGEGARGRSRWGAGHGMLPARRSSTLRVRARPQRLVG